MTTEPKAGFRLNELRASSFLRLTTVSIRPDGAMIPITGANAAGKSSVLKAFWALMKGRSAITGHTAVKAGNDEALLFGDLGQFKVTRTIKADPKTGLEEWSLKVVAADGTRQTTKPQALLDSWLGELSFDPLFFAKTDDKGRFDILKPLVKGFDFEDQAVTRDLAFKARTEANRRHTQAEAAANAVVLPGKKPAVVDVSAKLKELNDATAWNAELAERRRLEAIESAAIDKLRDDAEQLRARAATMEKEANSRTGELSIMAKLTADEKPAIDIAPLQDQIARAGEVSQTIALFDRRDEFEKNAVDAKTESANLTKIIDDIDAAKAAAIEAAKIPVKGLTMGDGVVLLNGLPFGQASTMEKIMASAAIGMAQKPDLKVMTIDEASELDSKALAALEKLAEKNDFQILFARVDESQSVGFVIEDGHVRS